MFLTGWRVEAAPRSPRTLAPGDRPPDVDAGASAADATATVLAQAAAQSIPGLGPALTGIALAAAPGCSFSASTSDTSKQDTVGKRKESK